METLTLEQAYYIGELVGVIAIVGSLIFLTLQVRQNTQIIRTGAMNQLSSTLVESLFALAWDTEIS